MNKKLLVGFVILMIVFMGVSFVTTYFMYSNTKNENEYRGKITTDIDVEKGDNVQISSPTEAVSPEDYMSASNGRYSYILVIMAGSVFIYIGGANLYNSFKKK